MEKALVSIALCTYNGEKYITKQLDSILAQTYKNIEVVVVDDASTDGTFDILVGYAQQDARIKCHRNDKNVGFNKNFEKAVSLTTGEYISISDQDDIWLDHKIAALMNALGNNWLVFSNSAYIDDNDQLLGKVLMPDFIYTKRSYKSMLLNNIVTGHTSLFNRELLPHLLPFPKGGFYDWWMGLVALYNQKLVYLDEVLTNYRFHEESVISMRSNNDKKTFNKLQRESLKTMLSDFVQYEELKPKDKIFIQKLLNEINADKAFFNISLLNIIRNNFYDLFAGGKVRKGLSKLNFAIKYTRQLSQK